MKTKDTMTKLQLAALAYATTLTEYHATMLHADKNKSHENDVNHRNARDAMYDAQDTLNSLAKLEASTGWAA